MEKITSISLELNFNLNTLGCYGLRLEMIILTPRNTQELSRVLKQLFTRPADRAGREYTNLNKVIINKSIFKNN